MTDPAITIVPANEASCGDLEAVLGARGYHGGCWCQRFKIGGRDWDSGAVPVAERANRLRDRPGASARGGHDERPGRLP